LTTEEVATALNLNAKQKERIAAQLEENQGQMRERMQEIMQAGDREAAGERMRQLRTEMDGKVLAILTSAQKAKFEEMKGEAFDMPRPQFGAPGGRGGQQQEQGAGGGRGQRGGGQRGGGEAPQRRRPGAGSPDA
jgi:hypothetical protein